MKNATHTQNATQSHRGTENSLRKMLCVSSVAQCLCVGFWLCVAFYPIARFSASGSMSIFIFARAFSM